MNKKLLAVALSSVLGVSSAFASGDAILNVEGEIQINGQTVIDNSGNFVGLEFAQQNQVVISDYYMSRDGVYTYVSFDGFKEEITVSGDSETMTGYYKDDLSGEYIKLFTDVWQDNGNGTYTNTWQAYSPEGAIDQSGSYTTRETELTSPVVNYQIGSLLVRAFEWETIDSSYPENIGQKEIGTSEFAYGGTLTSYTLADGTLFSDCLVGKDVEIRCKGVGVVEGYRVLESFVPAAEAQSAASSVSAKRDRSMHHKITSELLQK